MRGTSIYRLSKLTLEDPVLLSHLFRPFRKSTLIEYYYQFIPLLNELLEKGGRICALGKIDVYYQDWHQDEYSQCSRLGCFLALTERGLECVCEDKKTKQWRCKRVSPSGKIKIPYPKSIDVFRSKFAKSRMMEEVNKKLRSKNDI